MKYIGLDLGSRTCGVAISDISGFLARTYITIRFKDDDYETCYNEVIKILEKENVTKVVIGLPKHMNGDLGERAQISIDFKTRLDSTGKYEGILWDERLSTVAAERAMLEGNMSREYRKEHKDELAAVVILQNYLDYKK